jgi:VanZ family protein
LPENNLESNRFELPGSTHPASFAAMLIRPQLIRAWLPAVLWMAAIFVGSTDVLSSEHTSRFIGPLLRWLKPDISEPAVNAIQFAVRKCGHLSEYAVLAVLFRRALHLSASVPLEPWNWKNAFWALALSALYAASDEFHQSFVATRYASILDVGIDSAGAALGLGCFWLLPQAGNRAKLVSKSLTSRGRWVSLRK